jgi:uncharacterized protein
VTPLDETSVLEKLRELHGRVDARARELAERHAARLKCGPGCASCCQDDLTVFTAEAARIASEYPDVLHETPGLAGACAFLDEGGRCRVYAARPYVCRSQGLPLRWLAEAEDEDGWVEYRDICPLNEAGEPIEELEAEACFLLGPAEDVLRAVQAAFAEDALARVKLRDLFRK